MNSNENAGHASEIRALLARFDGVSIQACEARADSLFFDLRITDAASIVWIEHICTAAQVRSVMCALGPPVDGEEVAQSLGRLQFTYAIPVDEDQKHQWFGCHLVWNLVRREQLDKAEGERLLKKWNGRPRW
jgi:hypothetical protein